MRCLPLAILLAAVNLMFGCGQSASTKWGASACNGVDRALPNESKARMAGAIAAQLHAPAVEVLQSFRMGAWRIIYVDSPISDPPFLFFSGDPTSSRYVTLWSGAAEEDEAPAIYDWTLKNAPGIPQGLARCFAWHVTANPIVDESHQCINTARSWISGVIFHRPRWRSTRLRAGPNLDETPCFSRNDKSHG